MSSSEEPELMALAKTLASLAPAGGVNRDVLLFRAGQASVHRRWAWPIYAGVSTLAVLGLAAILLLRPPQIIHDERVVVVYVPEPSPSPILPPEQEMSLTSIEDAPHLDSDSFLFRREVLRHGVDAFPGLAPWTGTETATFPDRDLPPDVLSEPWLRQREASLSSGDAL